MNLTGIAVQGIRNKPADILAEFYLQMSDDGIEFRNQTDSNGNIEVNLILLARERRFLSLRNFLSSRVIFPI